MSTHLTQWYMSTLKGFETVSRSFSIVILCVVTEISGETNN